MQKLTKTKLTTAKFLTNHLFANALTEQLFEQLNFYSLLIK